MIYTESDKYVHSELTGRVIGCAYDVYNKLGYGFLEKVYKNALCIELDRIGIKAVQEVPLAVKFDGIVVGEYFADIIVEEKVILEIKAVSQLVKAHEVQLVNYLKATGVKVGLLINFGERIQVVRRVF